MIETRRYQIKLTTEEPFRIGGKEDPLSGEHGAVVVVGGRVAIPGPSLKGALRAAIEGELIDAYYDHSHKRWPDAEMGLQPCLPTARPSADEQALANAGMYRSKGCSYGGRGPTTICPACYLLGAQSMSGFLRVPFLFCNTMAEELYSLSLDRATGTGAGGRNRPYQLIPPETQLSGELEILWKDSLKSWEFGKPRPLAQAPEADAWLNSGDWDQKTILKKLVVQPLRSIRCLGGFRSKGFGRVRVEISAEQ